MKTRRLARILTSAYLSAMLTSSAEPIRRSTILATAIDPLAAPRALQGAMNGLNAAGWGPASTPASAVVPSGVVVSRNNPPLKAVAAMNEELMGRLIKFTLDDPHTGTVTARICKVLDLCDGSRDMPLKLSKSSLADGIHYFGVPPEAGSEDILIMLKRDTVIEAYLTDKTAKLRAAAILENGAARLITNERAAGKFAAELALFAKEALDLPPTGASVAGNP
ncbi:MAG: hypothetical protein HY403_11160 [Elusimicrobia bacterium]|nr:hypothetical protein [Elusimicrobiota bacterium]